MDPIGFTQPVIISAPVLPALSLQEAPQTTLPLPAPVPAGQNSNQDGVTAQAAEKGRLATVQQVAQTIANLYVVGDQKFTIFKDITGQYITRYTNLRDGKVTYIPEPTLYKLGGADNTPQLNIRA